MAREAAVLLYLFVFRLFFTIFSVCPQKKKTTFVASFGDNVLFTMRELEKQTDHEVVILKTAQCRVDFGGKAGRLVLDFEPRHFLEWIRSIYHLATSTVVFVDNYFGFLAGVRFKPNVKCIQLWHAAGAIKQFGLKDPSNHTRSPKAIERFKKVYDQFDHVVVGSEKMAAIFQESFGIGSDRILRTGIPRTDFFFDEHARKAAEDALARKFPIIQEKKVILYAPTYRDDELHVSSLVLDVEMMYRHLHEEYVLFLRLHPTVHVDLFNEYADFVYNVSSYPDVNELLIVTDLLITDYSSIPFEFSLLHRPMIFFAYDLEKYAESRGFWEPYEKMAPGPVVRSTEEILSVIENNKFDIHQIVEFANEWNQYSTGSASKQLIRAVYSVEEELLRDQKG